MQRYTRGGGGGGGGEQDTRRGKEKKRSEERYEEREAYLVLELRGGVVAFRLPAIRQFLLHRQQLWLSLRSSVPELHRHGFRLEVLRRIDARQHRASPRFRDYFRSISPRQTVAILETILPFFLSPFLTPLTTKSGDSLCFLVCSSGKKHTLVNASRLIKKKKKKKHSRLDFFPSTAFLLPLALHSFPFSFLSICSSFGSIFLESTASKITS